MPAGLIEELVNALRRLPGVGPKSARRMAYHLLTRDRAGATHLGALLTQAAERVGHCRSCRDLSEDAQCARCASPRRQRDLLCVVESPADVQAIEAAAGYDGLFFVLHGHLSPLDGIGPQELGVPALEARLSAGEVRELILATNPTVEGDATAQYLADLARRGGVRATRIAHGVPLGGDLEFVDGGTLRHAFSGRRDLPG